MSIFNFRLNLFYFFGKLWKSWKYEILTSEVGIFQNKRKVKLNYQLKIFFFSFRLSSFNIFFCYDLNFKLNLISLDFFYIKKWIISQEMFNSPQPLIIIYLIYIFRSRSEFSNYLPIFQSSVKIFYFTSFCWADGFFFQIKINLAYKKKFVLILLFVN